MTPRMDVSEILDRQHSWLEREWAGYLAQLRCIGSSCPLHNAPADAPPPCVGRGRVRHALSGGLLGAAVLVGLVLLACAVDCVSGELGGEAAARARVEGRR